MQADRWKEQRQRLLKDQRVRGLISRRAFELFLDRGSVHGKDYEDWVQAEEEIIALLQQLIAGEIKLVAREKPAVGVATGSAPTRRVAKPVPLVSNDKKKTLETPKASKKVTLRKKSSKAPAAGSLPQPPS